MALPDWIVGILLRPGETFERSRNEMTLSYWWILLSVFTIESVMVLYTPGMWGPPPTPPADAIIFTWIMWLMSIFTVQSLLFFGVARFFGWALGWIDTVKFIGLTWVLFLVEDLVTFYPVLRQQDQLLFWVSLPFIVWRLAVMVAGVRRLAGFSTGRSLGLVLAATLPWQLPLLWLNYSAIFLAPAPAA